MGFRDQLIRPNAVADLARIAIAALVEGALPSSTVAVVGPETLTLRDAVRRVAKVVGRRPFMFQLPVWFHYVLGWCVERMMAVPLVSVAQVRMLSEGLAAANPPCDAVPDVMSPRLPFTEEQIRGGLPTPGAFGLRDLRCCHGNSYKRPIVFFEMP